jgi:hypothetical protein
VALEAALADLAKLFCVDRNTSPTAGLASGVVMLWPPPIRGERVMLTCACQATVVWRVPLVFVYYLHVAQKGHGCVSVGHVSGKRIFAALEAVASRAGIPPTQ